MSDAEAALLAREISRRIEEELAYPGQIKVIVVRETRAIDYAKVSSRSLSLYSALHGFEALLSGREDAWRALVTGVPRSLTSRDRCDE